MVAPAKTAESPVITLPSLATRLDLTLWQLIGILNRNPALAAKLFRVGERRCLMAADLPAFQTAVEAARSAKTSV